MRRSSCERDRSWSSTSGRPCHSEVQSGSGWFFMHTHELWDVFLPSTVGASPPMGAGSRTTRCVGTGIRSGVSPKRSPTIVGVHPMRHVSESTGVERVLKDVIDVDLPTPVEGLETGTTRDWACIRDYLASSSRLLPIHVAVVGTPLTRPSPRENMILSWSTVMSFPSRSCAASPRSIVRAIR